MKRSLTAIFLGVVALVLGGLGGILVATPRAQQAAVQRGQTGRYQIVFSPHVRADTFMVDTDTGRIWRPTQYQDLEGDPTVLELEDRADTDAALLTWLRGHTVKAK